MKLQNLISAIALLSAASTLPFAAQAQQPATGVPVPVQTGPTVAPPATQPETLATQPAPLPPPLWTAADAQELLTFIRNIGKEGLSPADYDPDTLAAAMSAGDPLRLSEVATKTFRQVASDLALGHVRGKDRIDWHIKDPDLDDGRLDKLLRWAVHTHQVADTLTGLHPVHPQYAALKRALEVTPAGETEKLNRIRLNLDRWRWLPRDLGERYIIVNVPAYTAALVEKGETISRHYAVAGKISTPTPQLSAIASGVILNPWWEIPKSIEGEVRGKAGYVPVKGADGKVQRWRQPPGPTNALGQLKFVMPNSKAIYLHDTNAKSRFNARVRAFSHGCIRTKDIVELASILLAEDGGEWTPEKVQETLASGKTAQANFVKSLPVYIVYMSSAAHVDGRIIDYSDVYKRDGKAIAALLDTKTRNAQTSNDKVATR